MRAREFEAQKRADLFVGALFRLRYNENMIDDTPDYASYSLADLEDVRQRVNREKFPDRYEKIVAEIERRGSEQEPENNLREENPQARNLTGGLLFVGFSSWWLWVGLITPFTKMVESQSWAKTSCVIAESRYDQEDNKLIINYEYKFKGELWRNNQRTFLSRGDGYAGKSPSRTVKRYYVGRKMTCFVNPQDPQESVLFRDNYPIMWLDSIFPFCFFIGGLRLIIKRNELYLDEDGANSKNQD